MENTVVSDVVLDKKLDGYGIESKLQNFIAPKEITVTITLAEYRDLVSRCATAQADIDTANRDKYTRNSENEKLRAEVSELKAKLYELQNTEKSDETNSILQ